MLTFGQKIHPGLIFRKINKLFFFFTALGMSCGSTTLHLPLSQQWLATVPPQGSQVKLIMLRLRAASWCLHTLKPPPLMSSYAGDLLGCGGADLPHWNQLGLNKQLHRCWEILSEERRFWVIKGKMKQIWWFDCSAKKHFFCFLRGKEPLLLDLLFRSKIITEIAFGLSYCVAVSRK